MTDYTVNGAAICAHETVGCGTYVSGNYYVTGVSINAYDPSVCPFTLGVFPNGDITQWENTDLVFSVWANQTQLTVDNATVEFVITDPTGDITKSTEDYSVITFGNTLVVHINPGELLADSTMAYTATITTSDDLEYSMTGRLIASESSINICFKTDVNIFERPITIINAVQRDAIKVISERTTPLITCDNAPPILPITERTSDIIIIAPCGKRIGA